MINTVKAGILADKIAMFNIKAHTYNNDKFVIFDDKDKKDLNQLREQLTILIKVDYKGKDSEKLLVPVNNRTLVDKTPKYNVLERDEIYEDLLKEDEQEQ